LTEELKILGLSPEIKEQVPLYRRAKIDLLVGNVAVEIKAKGSFGDDDKKYSGYLDEVRKKGWVYCHLTGSETHPPYRSATKSAFGKRSFFLDEGGDWERFVREVVENIK